MSKKKTKQLFYQSIKIIAYVNIALYLLACLTPFISSAYFFGFTFLALGFPILLIGMIFWLVVSLFKCFSSSQKSTAKQTLLLLVFILCGYKNITSSFGFHAFSQSKKSNHTLRVLSWNVKNFVTNDSTTALKSDILKNMMLYIKNTNADIFCVQDFGQLSPKPYCQFIDYITDSLHFPYHYFSVDIDTTMLHSRTQYGTCIFSKHPIQRFRSINYSGKHFTESIGFADIEIRNQSIRIFNTHLRSMYLGIEKTQTQADFKYVINDTNLVFHSSKFYKLKYFDTAHIQQAILIKKIMDTTNKPFIFCADLNAVPSSFVYHHISNNLNDAFVQKGFGWGGTYSNFLPFFRIDVILMSKDLNAITYTSPKLELSDHYPVVVDVDLGK